MLRGVSEISPGKGCLMPGDYLPSGRVSQPVRSASPATARVQGEARTKPFQPVVSRATPTAPAAVSAAGRRDLPRFGWRRAASRTATAAPTALSSTKGFPAGISVVPPAVPEPAILALPGTQGQRRYPVPMLSPEPG